MRALVFDRGTIRLDEVPEATLEGGCRIRVRMAGICGTDLQLLEGYADGGGIPGHEFVGVVDAVSSPADAALVGKRVVGEINVGCGRCEWCAAGVKEHCINRTVLGIRGHHGAFADYLHLPAVNLHEIPSTMPDEGAVFVEPVAAACRIREQLTIDEHSRVAILGDGRMGLIVGQVIRTYAPDVTMFGRHDYKLEIGRSLGLATAPADSKVPARQRFDVVVDVTGRPEGLTRALSIVRPRGTIVVKSTFHGEAPLESWPIVVDEVTLIGSRCGPFRPAIDLLASGAVKVAPLISRVVRLEDYASAFAEARRAIKILFDVSAGTDGR
jgi:threonine dehydrogenase-like Zn-dependent dehydrogenase